MTKNETVQSNPTRRSLCNSINSLFNYFFPPWSRFLLFILLCVTGGGQYLIDHWSTLNPYDIFGVFYVTVFSTLLLMDRKKTRQNLFLISYYINFAIPFILAGIGVYISYRFDFDRIILILYILFSMSVPSWLYVRYIKEEKTYIKDIKIALDYNEYVYWSVSGILLLGIVPLSHEGEFLCKVLSFPFLAQTRLIKAYIGQILR
ncbi:hypothetical protein [Paenibacillus hamazuiensis]|uniref:hypothetical protein n=1 Tax=Paenibacillus hamazuiensis TaxID=2936508 RepID=UPI00200D4E22|nr:hypothetical protein [Paenibacillus hamazuiensis]